MKTLFSSSVSYRVETSWPNTKSWGWLPEHGNLTLKRAREVVKQGKPYEQQGMQQRVIQTKTTETIVPVNVKHVMEEYLLCDCATTLRKVNYDRCWHLVRGKKVKRISPNRAAALKGAFLRDPCRRTPLIAM